MIEGGVCKRCGQDFSGELVDDVIEHCMNHWAELTPDGFSALIHALASASLAIMAFTTAVVDQMPAERQERVRTLLRQASEEMNVAFEEAP